MDANAAPYFIRPHRFDDPEPDDDTFPWLDWRGRIVLDSDERVLWQGRVELAGYLLGRTVDDSTLSWKLPRPADVVVTDRRLAYVCAGWDLDGAPAAGRAGPRHLSRTGRGGGRVATGQVRWQWPARLHLRPGAGPRPHTGPRPSSGSRPSTGPQPSAPGRAQQMLIVCDTLRSAGRPTLAVGGGTLGSAGAVRDLAHLVRRAVARFRLAHPVTVELAPPERDALVARMRTSLFTDELADPRRGVDLPGALLVEFVHRDDYYRRSLPGTRTGGHPERLREASSGHPGSAV